MRYLLQMQRLAYASFANHLAGIVCWLCFYKKKQTLLVFGNQTNTDIIYNMHTHKPQLK